ncbi:Mediator complex subunit 6 [Caenorhabditis elegans]|uniref:Mediator complex subunit 6 n=2 Tax=Caenorhabditis elegans TaxID=6239 RepID=A0A0K3ASG1_CAEEL|nr:Mediator complex subunit 6 [Caenorhabditis elegans]CTQ86794.1 Mediator complex subunit 6 [Caenorhabditis elegans]|eukprot:NP_001300095.1 Uncharacterized protein CELE_F33E11.2 [Caenorhabditis elegans]
MSGLVDYQSMARKAYEKLQELGISRHVTPLFAENVTVPIPGVVFLDCVVNDMTLISRIAGLVARAAFHIKNESPQHGLIEVGAPYNLVDNISYPGLIRFCGKVRNNLGNNYNIQCDIFQMCQFGARSLGSVHNTITVTVAAAAPIPNLVPRGILAPPPPPPPLPLPPVRRRAPKVLNLQKFIDAYQPVQSTGYPIGTPAAAAAVEKESAAPVVPENAEKEVAPKIAQKLELCGTPCKIKAEPEDEDIIILKHIAPNTDGGVKRVGSRNKIGKRSQKLKTRRL